jgi:hypothetical protein
MYYKQQYKNFPVFQESPSGPSKPLTAALATVCHACPCSALEPACSVSREGMPAPYARRAGDTGHPAGIGREGICDVWENALLQAPKKKVLFPVPL